MKVRAVIYVYRDGEDGEEEIEVSLVGHYTPGSPGRTYGPPEDCYPAEPEDVELEVALVDGKPFELTEHEEELALEELAVQAQEEMESDYDDSENEEEESYEDYDSENEL